MLLATLQHLQWLIWLWPNLWSHGLTPSASSWTPAQLVRKKASKHLIQLRNFTMPPYFFHICWCFLVIQFLVFPWCHRSSDQFTLFGCSILEMKSYPVILCFCLNKAIIYILSILFLTNQYSVFQWNVITHNPIIWLHKSQCAMRIQDHQEWNEFIPSKSWGSTLPSLISLMASFNVHSPPRKSRPYDPRLMKIHWFPFWRPDIQTPMFGKGATFFSGKGVRFNNQPSQKSPRSWRRVKWRLQSSRSTFTTPSEGEWRNTFRKRGLTLLHCCDRGGVWWVSSTTLYHPILPIVSIVPHYTTYTNPTPHIHL